METKKIDQLKKEIENILNDNKALEIKSINLRDKTSIADFMIIASGNSSKHIQALSEIILNQLNTKGINDCRLEGRDSSEWKLIDAKDIIIHIFHPEKKILPMAGLWTTWQSPKLNFIESYTIITTTPQKPIAHIHNRMPVIIENKMINKWINCESNSLNSALNLLKPFPCKLSFYPVSNYINSPKNNSRECTRSIQDSVTINLFK